MSYICTAPRLSEREELMTNFEMSAKHEAQIFSSFFWVWVVFFKQYIPILLVNSINMPRSRRAQAPLCRTYTDTSLRENLVVTEGPCCTSFSLPNCCTQTLAKPFFLGKLTTKYSLPALNQHCWETMLSVTGHISPPAILSNWMCPLSGANDIQHLELGLIPLGMRLQRS